MANGLGHGSEYAVVLPTGNATETFQWALQMRDKQRQEKLLREKQLRDQQEDLTRLLDSELDYSKFATGTPSDPVNINALRDLKMKYSQEIMRGKYNSTASLTYDMQNDLAKLVSYSNNAKMVRDNINKELESYKNQEGIDHDALYKGAIRSAFMKIDPTTGQPTVNEQLDPGQSYARQYLKEHPEKVLTGPQSLVKTFSGLKTTKYQDVFQDDIKGRKRKLEVTAELLPYQEIDIKNGTPVGVKFKTEDLKLSNGKTVKGLPQSAVDEFFAGHANNAILDMAMKQQYPTVLESNSDYPALRRKVALEIANQMQRGSDFIKKDVSDQDVWAGKMQAGIPPSTKEKEKKENVFEVLKNIKKGDLSYLSDSTPDAAGLINITPALPGAIMYSGRIKKKTDGTASKEAFNGVFYNPTTKTFWVQEDSRGKNSGMREIKQGKEREEFQKLAEANNVPVKDFLEIWKDVSGSETKKGSGSFMPGFMNTVKKVLTINKAAGSEKKEKTEDTKKKKKYNPATGKFE
jgi:hypothetical protein